MRSMLFVPGDDDRKLERARCSGADALILDLEDAVAPDRKAVAREKIRAHLEQPRETKLYVRVNALSEADAVKDLAAVVGGRPDGIMLPKCAAPALLRDLDLMLMALEVREGIAAGQVKILPIAIETPASIFQIGGYRNVSRRLSGMMWGVEDLAVELSSQVSEAGAYLPAVELGRSLCLYAAAAAGVPAVDAAYADFRDIGGLTANAQAAQRAGFSAKVAIHPSQVPIINAAFTPSEDAVDWAKSVVDAFAQAGGKGAVGLNGRMLDRPHQKAAQRILQRAGREPEGFSN